jgi:hypothetical protein
MTTRHRRATPPGVCDRRGGRRAAGRRPAGRAHPCRPPAVAPGGLR